MATALIIAGGVGKRMGMDIPKQFIMVDGKPIIIYTLESFQAHPDVDQILVVCKEGWDETLWGYVHQYKLDKVKWIIKGGTLGQYSINNGVQFLKDHCDDDDIVVIHDGIRPLVDELVLSDVIVKAKKYGNAVTSMPYNEQIFIKKTEETTTQYINRNTLRRVSTPQAYQFGKLRWAYDKAVAEDIGMTDFSYTNTMMVDLGETLHFAAGSDKNIKLTTTGDLQMFKAYLNMKA